MWEWLNFIFLPVRGTFSKTMQYLLSGIFLAQYPKIHPRCSRFFYPNKVKRSVSIRAPSPPPLPLPPPSLGRLLRNVIQRNCALLKRAEYHTEYHLSYRSLQSDLKPLIIPSRYIGILVPIALFSSLSRQVLGTRIEGLWRHTIFLS